MIHKKGITFLIYREYSYDAYALERIRMKNQRKVFQALTLILQFGLNMLVPIGMCTALGIWIDRRYDMPWAVIILFFVGALAGFTSIFKMAKPFMKADRKRHK